ncbi:MAG: PqqD family protein [Anaerolineaceae bacterium]|jgi:uncharacterized protein YjbK|nr:PqqD family peptide modification chaperone [Chloroflexota bacterium]UCC51348.1 MAG: PqqD family protein [Anaerolineaceae bacterium]
MNESVSVPENVLFRELEGESVILSLDNETYYGLDDVGTRMWLQLTTQPTVQDAYNALLHEYEVEPDELQNDLARLVSELVAAGLLDRTGG